MLSLDCLTKTNKMTSAFLQLRIQKYQHAIMWNWMINLQLQRHGLHFKSCLFDLKTIICQYHLQRYVKLRCVSLTSSSWQKINGCRYVWHCENHIATNYAYKQNALKSCIFRNFEMNQRLSKKVMQIKIEIYWRHGCQCVWKSISKNKYDLKGYRIPCSNFDSRSMY